MAATERELRIKLSASDAASSVFRKAGEEVDKFARKAASAGPAGGGGTLQNLKSRLSGSSDAADILDIATGAGLTAALHAAGEVLGRATAGVVTLRDELQKGEKSAAELTQNLLASLPVFGGFAKAGADIRELITGQQARIKELTAEAELFNRTIEVQKNLVKQVEESHKRTLDTIKEIRQAYALAGLSQPEQSLERLRSEDDAFRERALREADEARQKLTARDSESRKQRDALEAQRRTALAAEGEAATHLERVRRATANTLRPPGTEHPDVRQAASELNDRVARRKTFSAQIEQIDRANREALDAIDRDAKNKLAEREKLTHKLRSDLLKSQREERAKEHAKDADESIALLERIAEARRKTEQEVPWSPCYSAPPAPAARPASRRPTVPANSPASPSPHANVRRARR
jgi:DNA repair exonuclease SbcCD ATPase subunit